MDVFVYCSQTNGIDERLRQGISPVVPGKHVELHRTIESFALRLSQLRFVPAIAVVLVTEQEELDRLVAIDRLFGDVRLILILPDWHQDTISKAHRLRPRFLTCIHNSMKEVQAVLGKMLSYPVWHESIG